MEAVINRNMLSVRVYFLYTCMNEVGYNWKYDGRRLFYPEFS